MRPVPYTSSACKLAETEVTSLTIVNITSVYQQQVDVLLLSQEMNAYK